MAVLAFVVTALAFASTFSPSASTHFRGFTMNFHAVGNQENGVAGEVRTQSNEHGRFKTIGVAYRVCSAVRAGVSLGLFLQAFR